MSFSGLTIYTFARTPTYPISATGGWIDVNGDGKKDAGDAKLDITLKSYTTIVTPVTTYIADTNKTIRESRLQGLKDRLNAPGVGLSAAVSEEELLGLASQTQNLDFVFLVNAIYKDMKEHGGTLGSSDENSILSQFTTIGSLTSSTNPTEIEASVMADLNSSGHGAYIPASELPDENTTSGTPDANNTSSSGVYIATSNETMKNIHEIYGSPLLKDSKVYARLYRALNIDVNLSMKVLSYDISNFNHDINLSDLPTNTLYEQTGPNYTTGHFNQRYYDIASDTVLYHVKRDPVEGKNHDTTFDLARGWFIPFQSGQYMGIVEDAVVKAIDVSDGASYKYGTYDYFGIGDGGGSYTDGMPPVATDSGFFNAFDGDFYNVSFLSGSTLYGVREVAKDAQYIVNNILTDVNANYSGSKNYYYVEQTAPLILDGTNIYLLASLKYDDAEGFPAFDLYLINYGTDSSVKSVTFVDGSTTRGSWFDVYQTYKYNNRLYFKFRHDGKNELSSNQLIIS